MNAIRYQAGPVAVNSRWLILHALWLSALLGVGLEMIMIVMAGRTEHVPGIGPIVAGLALRVTWAVILGTLMAAGMGFGKNLRLLVLPVIGFFVAPLAFEISRSVHGFAFDALGIGMMGVGGGSSQTLDLMKGIEYAVLGAAIAWVAPRPKALSLMLVTGLVCGAVFTSANLLVRHLASPDTLRSYELMSQLINDFFTPLGLGLVLLAAEWLATRRR